MSYSCRCSVSSTFTFFKKAANKGYEENTSTLGTTATVRLPVPCSWRSPPPLVAVADSGRVARIG